MSLPKIEMQARGEPRADHWRPGATMKYVLTGIAAGALAIALSRAWVHPQPAEPLPDLPVVDMSLQVRWEGVSRARNALEESERTLRYLTAKREDVGRGMVHKHPRGPALEIPPGIPAKPFYDRRKARAADIDAFFERVNRDARESPYLR